MADTLQQDATQTTSDTSAAAVTGGTPPSAAAGQTESPASSDYRWADDWREFDKFAKANNYRPSDLLSAFTKPAQQTQHAQPGERAAQTRTETGGKEREAAPDTRSLIDQAKNELRREMLLGEHKSMATAEEKQFGKLLEGIKNSPYSDEVKDLFEAALRGRLEQSRLKSLYPDGHPLRNEYLRPVGEETFADLNTWYKRTETAIKAGLLAKIGEAASKASRGTPAGDSGGQGKPKNESKPGSEMDDDEAALAIARRTFAQMRGSVAGS